MKHIRSCTLTILICTHNRAALLQQALASLNIAKRPRNASVDILVVANACTDRTHQLLSQYQRESPTRGWLPLSWFAEPRPGKSYALNSAIPRLRGDLVAFVDDDHRVDPNYLQAVCSAAHNHPDADLFCGRILPDWNGNEPPWVHQDGPYRIYPLPIPHFDLGPVSRFLSSHDRTPGGGNLAARTRILGRVGPFDPSYGPRGHDLEGAEDLQWVHRAMRMGLQLHYVPEMVQYHHVDLDRLKLIYLICKAYKRSASTIRLHPERIGDIPLPPYMIRKVIGYLGRLVVSWHPDQWRFYLVRLAAALGEIRGHLQARAERNRTIAAKPE